MHLYLTSKVQTQVLLCGCIVLPSFLFSMTDPLIRYSDFGFAAAPSTIVRFAIAYERLQPVYAIYNFLENMYKRNLVFTADAFAANLDYVLALREALEKPIGQTGEESSYKLDPAVSRFSSSVFRRRCTIIRHT
ncbi:uncharacterized protein BYT42DRAFT_174952 [Radiomyces spectabilis]|uniref:uncharacterized protein n=1 Tax=Radiomyces spectabilis TaxID=64574 RepID=UPI00221F2BE4|nr:uncharacterized protein BYT42DRAFT_174952 [Radiomyces spectabilis]KAI8390929.1 hypothetical protein BYT42DRAFT_174952 [Radiomyces spectabilis]